MFGGLRERHRSRMHLAERRPHNVTVDSRTLRPRLYALGFRAVLILSIFCNSIWARPWQERSAGQTKDLTSLSLDELMKVEVTSASKKEEKLFSTAAAVYVITREEIRRSGMESIPELLRLAPGLDVTRIDGTKWAISVRGFNGRFSNKLLVLIDGRSVYSPETSGVYWEVQDVLLEDIERIEIIRGPGGTLWGANAVNGVINIITRSAEDTVGGLVTVSSGTEEQGNGSIRYGGRIREGTFYRVYGKYFNHVGLAGANGRTANDGHNAIRGGGRIDWTLNDRDSLTLEGDIYKSHLRENPIAITVDAPFAPPINRPGDFSGGNFLGRWARTFSERSSMALQVYYDCFNRDIFELPASVDTVDVDFQHHTSFGTRNDLVWGFDYRHVWHHTAGSTANPVQLNPNDESTSLLSVFAEDDITLVKDRLRLMIGSKLEHYKELGDTSAVFNLEPSARMLWTPQRHQTVWAAVSRAVRTPARSDTDIRGSYSAFPGPDGLPNILAFFGNHDFKSETVLAYEAGYRVRPVNKLSLDTAAFYNVYDRLQTFEPGTPFFEADPQPHVIIPLVFSNLMRGNTYGIETAANFDASAVWQLSGSYSFLRMQLRPYAESLDHNSKQAIEGSNPRHQFQLHSSFRLPRSVELDASLFFVSQLAYLHVPDYARFDARVAWQIAEALEVSAGAQNLFSDKHAEFGGNDAAVLASEVKRIVYGKVTWRF